MSPALVDSITQRARNLAGVIVDTRPSLDELRQLLEIELTKCANEIDALYALEWLTRVTEEARKVKAQLIAGDLIALEEMTGRHEPDAQERLKWQS